MVDESIKTMLDRTSLGTDLVKHISTLASGSIILLATFLGKVQPLTDTASLIAGIALLMACIVFCTVYLGFFGITRTWVHSSDQVPRAPQKLERFVAFLAFATFCVGIVFVGISVVRTLQAPPKP